MRSEAESIERYLSELPLDRKAAIETVRSTIVSRLPDGYQEIMNWGMITYSVPLSVYPDTYNGKPLMYAALASQKNHMAVYLTGIYMSDDRRKVFEAAYRKTGKRLDMGKSCVRFKNLTDLPLDLVGDSIASIPLEQFVAEVKAVGSTRKR